MSRTAWDVIVVGGGILGLSTAMEITRRHPEKRVLVLEKEADVGRHQSLHNSGVIHAGLYYRPGSLKAKTCVEGAAAMVRFAQEHGIDHEICGKVVVATNEAEIPRLEELRRRGVANGIENIAVLGPEELREIEPHARGVKALRVPSTGIIDYGGVVRAYARIITAGGQKIQTSAQVTGITVLKGERRVETTAGDFAGKLIVNCAGLYADRIAKLAGGAPPMKIVPFRGEYYELTPGRRSLVKSLIYPVPDPAFPFLGVHFTRRVNGSVEAGPNAVLAYMREGYTKTGISPYDLLETLTYPGFLKLARKYWKVGLGEMVRSVSKSAFTRALQKLMPEIRESDLVPAGAGVRAQAVDREGGLLDDFSIIRTEGAVHVCNAPSPGATASLMIGPRHRGHGGGDGGLRASLPICKKRVDIRITPYLSTI